MDWLAGATRSPMQEDGFDWQVACPTKGVLHTTEGSSWPNYPSQYEPHLTVRPSAGKGIEVRQHIAFSKAAYALKHPAGTTQTNGAHAIQMELIGTCDKGGPGYYWPAADDAVLTALWLQVIKPISDTFHIPLKAPTFLPYPGSYGNTNVRLSGGQWLAWNGWLGHQHVPGNDHGDPGAFPWARLVYLAHPPKPHEVIHGPVAYGATGASVRIVQAHVGSAVDGDFGRITQRHVETFQTKHHLTADGVVGPKTAAAMGCDYVAA
jgi:peptidoglycan hydrolase-like protein with peptidoglycan-binding domain